MNQQFYRASNGNYLKSRHILSSTFFILAPLIALWRCLADQMIMCSSQYSDPYKTRP